MPLVPGSANAPGAEQGKGGKSAQNPLAVVVTTFSDISAYMNAREAIRISEERYRGLVESLPVMVVQADRDRRLTYINPATEAITGYSLSEIADPVSWAKRIHTEDLPRVHEISKNALGGKVDRGEIRYRAKDDSEKVAYIISQPHYLAMEVVGITTLMVDVTRERKLERDLQRAQRLELIGRLSSGVAHDFNNLLSVVLNLTDLARGHLPPEHPVHADLGRIADAGEQAANLATQLLTFSKQKTITPRRVEINGVARRTLELLKTALPGNISIQTDLAPGDVPINADETQVQQVLMNLCLNARDAMPRGGTLHITTCLEPVPAEAGATAERPCPSAQLLVRLTVEDSGKGMSEELRGRIFEPFFSTRKEEPASAWPWFSKSSRASPASSRSTADPEKAPGLTCAGRWRDGQLIEAISSSRTTRGAPSPSAINRTSIARWVPSSSENGTPWNAVPSLRATRDDGRLLEPRFMRRRISRPRSSVVIGFARVKVKKWDG